MSHSPVIPPTPPTPPPHFASGAAHVPLFQGPIALVLVLTRAVPLTHWRDSGVLEREWALYQRLGRRLAATILVTDGDHHDEAIARQLGAECVAANASGSGQSLAARVLEALKRAAPGASAVVKTNQFEGGAAAVEIARVLRESGVETALFARGGYPHSRFAAWRFGTDSEAARAAAEEERLLCTAADLVVGTTSSMVEDLCWRYSVPSARSAVVPNYVNELNIPSGRLEDREPATILVAGRLEKQKRVDLVIRALATLPRGRGVRLDVVGSGSEETSLRELALTLGVPVLFKGRLRHQELLERMAHCTVFVQCSAFEGHPKTVLEAMATGAAVVVSSSPGMAGVVEHGRSGWCVPWNGSSESEELAVDGISRGLLELLSSPQERRRLGGAARDVVLSRCSLDRVSHLEIESYQRAMANAGARSHALAPTDPSTYLKFAPALLDVEPAVGAAAWARVLSGFQRRLPAAKRTRFLMALDAPLYQMQGLAAVAASAEAHGSAAADSEGLHPKHRLMRYHDFFVERIGRDELVVDLGCGVGALAASIAERADAIVVGMDWSEQNLARARDIAARRGLADRLTYFHGDITRTEVPGDFDCIVLSNVLEHLKDRPELLRRWVGVYAAKRFLIRVPAFDREWRVPYKRELGVEWRLDDTHETEYTEAQLRDELTQAGLQMVELVTRWGEYWCDARPVQGA